MRRKNPFLFPAYALFIALHLGAAPRSVAGEAAIPPDVSYATASDKAIDTMPMPDFEMSLQSGAGGELPGNLFGDSIRMLIKVSSVSPSPDTLTAALSCSESKDSLRLFLVEDSAEAGTYLSQVIPIRLGSANADGKLDCLEPDILEAEFRDPVYLDRNVIAVLVPGSVSVRGQTVARAASVGAHDGFLRGGDLASRPPEGIACFDLRGGIIGWASPIGEAVWRLPAGTRPAALRMRYPDGSMRHQIVIPGR